MITPSRLGIMLLFLPEKTITMQHMILWRKIPVLMSLKRAKELGQMEAILGADQTICSLADDIFNHYGNYQAGVLTGKAMIVAFPSYCYENSQTNFGAAPSLDGKK